MIATIPPPTKTLRVSARQVISLDEITHLTAEGNYTYVHLKDGRCYLRSKTMRYFERLLDSRYFFRTDKSCMVNLCHVTAIKPDSIEVTYLHQLPISRRKRKQVRNFQRLLGQACGYYISNDTS